MLLPKIYHKSKPPLNHPTQLPSPSHYQGPSARNPPTEAVEAGKADPRSTSSQKPSETTAASAYPDSQARQGESPSPRPSVVKKSAMPELKSEEGQPKSTMAHQSPAPPGQLQRAPNASSQALINNAGIVRTSTP